LTLGRGVSFLLMLAVTLALVGPGQDGTEERMRSVGR
jgi:hypothetical protein